MKFKISCLSVIGFLFSATCFGFGLSDKSFFTIDPLDISYFPRAYVSGFVGSNEIGSLDIISPLMLGDNNALFAYLQGRIANKLEGWQKNTWTGSLGLGYRQIYKERTYGGYLLADYNNAPSGNKFWVISPGIESLGEIFDYRINAYFPTSKEWVDEAWADERGDYQWVEFKGHNKYDHLYRYYENTGAGIDAEFGGILFTERLRGFVDIYHFSVVNDNNITGLGLRLNYQVNNRLNLQLSDSYDGTQHNVFMAGVQMTLGGSNTNSNLDNYNQSENIFDKEGNYLGAKPEKTYTPPSVYYRLLDPIERNFGSAKYGTTVPVTSGNYQDFGKGLELSNIWFFDASKTCANSNSCGEYGTFENPYAGEQFTQATVDYIATKGSQTNLYFRPGSYNTPDIILRNNQSMWGRTYNYLEPASGNNRALFLGSLNLSGNNILDSIRLQSANTDAVGAIVQGSNVTINNVLIGADNNQNGYRVGVDVGSNLSGINISNSEIHAYRSGSTADVNATGIHVGNGSSLSLSTSNVIANSNATGVIDQTGNAYGIQADGQGDVLEIQNSTITASGNAGNTAHSGNGYGILIGKNYLQMLSQADDAVRNNSITISTSKLSGSGSGGTDTAISNAFSYNGYGLFVGYGYGVGDHLANLSIHDNAINISSSNLKGLSIAGQGGIDSHNGYGILVGFEYGKADNNANLSVYANSASIQASTLEGNGNSTDNIATDSVGIGYGLLLGFGRNQGLTLPDIYSNDVNISNTVLRGTGFAPVLANAGRGAGLVIGYERFTTLDRGKIYNNQLTMNYDLINAYSNSVSSPAFGLRVGFGGKVGSGNNSVAVDNSSITVRSDNSSEKKAFGIWMLNNGGTLSIDSYTLGNIIRTDGATAGDKIIYPDGTTISW